ncbi:MAG: GntR family transcriptional regulator [Clostridia bacterium]|nr:GntR family transcriptional regulator [Clostridia bacterium]MBR6780183.1 GntR family transcriptional regulator [Clostridia bacterium]
MIHIDRQSRVPVFEQIKNELMKLIALGVLEPHSRLPSIRQIAAETGVNINTVKKAFAELEMHGVIYSVPGTGSFVNLNALSDENLRKNAFLEVETAVKAAKAKGIAMDEVLTLIRDLYNKEDANDD